MDLGGSLLLLVLFLVGAPVLFWLGQLLSRGFGSSVFGLLIPVGGLIGVFVGGSLYLDADGPVVPSVIVARHEDIIRNVDGWSVWGNRTLVDVRYQPLDTGEPATVSIAVDAPTYDRLSVGDTATIRYLPLPLAIARFLPIHPNIARLAEQSTVSLAMSLIPWSAAPFAGLALGGYLLVRFWFRVRSTRHVLFVGGLIWAGTAGLLIVVPMIAPESPVVGTTTTANVLLVDRITEISSSDEGPSVLQQPFDIVEVEFVPLGMTHPVKAVDEVDSGSLPGLVQGGTAAMTYSDADPRKITLVGGTRRHRWVNTFAEVGGILVALVLFGLAAALYFVVRGRVTAWYQARVAAAGLGMGSGRDRPN